MNKNPNKMVYNAGGAALKDGDSTVACQVNSLIPPAIGPWTLEMLAFLSSSQRSFPTTKVLEIDYKIMHI